MTEELITKRELFALVFMATLMSRPNCPNTVTAAGVAVAAADDLMTELNGWKRAES